MSLCKSRGRGGGVIGGTRNLEEDYILVWYFLII